MTEPIDIRPVDLAIVQKILRDVLPPNARVWVFGSRATWTTKDSSDLDLAIDAARPLSRRESTDLAEALDESDLPWKVDVVDWASTSESFRRIIKKNRVAFPLGEKWRKTKWGKEISLEYGKAIRDYKNAIAPYRVFGTNGPVGWADAPLAPGPGIILGRKGAYRGVHFSRKPFFVIDTAYYVKPKSEDLDMRWLYYAIIYHKLGEIDDGSPIPSTTRAAVYVRDLEVPPPPEQQAIASTLASMDDKIDLNRRMNETLEAMARAIFKDWFVDFGPTRAKMEGREPYLAQEIWDLFPDKLDDDGLPDGWVFLTIGEVLDILDNKRIPLSKREREKRKGPYPYHGATSVMDYVDDYLFDEILLLLGEDGSVAKPNGHPFTQYVWDKIWVNNHAHVLKGKTISTEQLKCFFDQADIVPFVTGAVQLKLNQGNLKSIPIVKAAANIHQAFDELITPMFASIRRNSEEIKTLIQTRDLLLPKLMSGEICVQATPDSLEVRI